MDLQEVRIPVCQESFLCRSTAKIVKPFLTVI